MPLSIPVSVQKAELELNKNHSPSLKVCVVSKLSLNLGPVFLLFFFLLYHLGTDMLILHLLHHHVLEIACLNL